MPFSSSLSFPRIPKHVGGNPATSKTLDSRLRGNDG